MKKLVLATIICMAVVLGGIVLTVIGILNTTQVKVMEDFQSDILENEPDIAVYLPPSYEMKLYASYPVLYMFGDTDLFGDIGVDDDQWTMKDTLDRLIMEDELLQEMVVVAVYVSEADKASLEEKQSIFVANELEPYIQKQYRVLAEPDQSKMVAAYFGEGAILIDSLPNTFDADQRLEQLLLVINDER